MDIQERKISENPEIDNHVSENKVCDGLDAKTQFLNLSKAYFEKGYILKLIHRN